MVISESRISDSLAPKLWNLYDDRLNQLIGQYVQFPPSANFLNEPKRSDGKDYPWAKLFEQKERARLFRDVSKDISTTERGKRIIRDLKDSPMRKDVVDHILQLVQETDSSEQFSGPDSTLGDRLIGASICEAGKKSSFERILKNLDVFVGFLIPSSLFEDGHLSDTIVDHMSKFPVLLQDTRELQSPKSEEVRELQVRIFIRELPYCRVTDWDWEFFSALESASHCNNKKLLGLVYVYFKEEYDEYIRDKELQVKSAQLVDVGASLEDALKANEQEDNPMKQSFPISVQLDDQSCGDYGRIEDRDPIEELALRDYQEELAKPVLEGKNTIVCAPTGSGKTWVAVKIILDHLNKATTSRKPLVAFLVPTVPLVEQQLKVVNRFLPRTWKSGSIAGGDSNAPKHLLIQDYHIVVMTPQILLNMLRESDKTDRLSIEKISLLIFDECHHCDQQHPYNDIMTYYMAKKFGVPGFSPSGKPQVVALTASLGVGKKTEQHWQATEHVLKLAANMDAEELSIVRDNMAGLEQVVNAPADKCIQVSGDHQNNAFSRLIESIMMKIEKIIEPFVAKFLREKLIEGIQKEPPKHDRWNIQAYGNWVHQLLAKVPSTAHTDSKITLVACLEHLRFYHLALELNAHLPAVNAAKFLKDNLGSLCPRTEIDGTLFNLYRNDVAGMLDKAVASCPQNPLIEELVRILSEERNNRENFRAIVFVRRRNLALALKECLMKIHNGLLSDLNVEILTAVNAASDKGGQTAAIQKEILADFRSGRCRVIVATTVAEEGLDIEECNLIIKYNHVTNEIAMVQRRGRGRAEGSRSVLLALENWIAKKETINAFRERLMHNAIQDVKQMDPKAFRQLVEDKAKQMYKDRVMKEIIEEQKKNELRSLNKTFLILCSKCDQKLCDSTEISQVQSSHFVSVCSTIWERVNAKPLNLEAVEKFQKLSIPGKAYCTKCNNLLGNVVKFKDVYLPTLKADALILQEPAPNGYPPKPKQRAKKWKKITKNFFIVEEIENVSLVVMSKNPPYSAAALDSLLASMGA